MFSLITFKRDTNLKFSHLGWCIWLKKWPYMKVHFPTISEQAALIILATVLSVFLALGLMIFNRELLFENLDILQLSLVPAKWFSIRDCSIYLISTWSTPCTYISHNVHLSRMVYIHRCSRWHLQYTFHRLSKAD